jgi:hypothetical protein
MPKVCVLWDILAGLDKLAAQRRDGSSLTVDCSCDTVTLLYQLLQGWGKDIVIEKIGLLLILSED